MQIMSLLRKMIIEGLDVSKAIGQFIENIPDIDSQFYIGPLIVFHLLKDKYLEKVRQLNFKFKYLFSYF